MLALTHVCFSAFLSVNDLDSFLLLSKTWENWIIAARISSCVRRCRFQPCCAFSTMSRVGNIETLRIFFCAPPALSANFPLIFGGILLVKRQLLSRIQHRDAKESRTKRKNMTEVSELAHVPKTKHWQKIFYTKEVKNKWKGTETSFPTQRK